METYTITCQDSDGNEQTIDGGSLESLRDQLAAAGYEGGSIRVTDDPGFTVGWVSAETWSAT